MAEKNAQVTLKQGMPPEQKNGLYGHEDQIMDLGVKGRFQAVVTVEVADIVSSEANGTTRPVVDFVHIEPIWSAEGAATTAKVQEDQYKVRTGANQLDLDDEPAADDQAVKDAEFDAAAPKAKK